MRKHPAIKRLVEFNVDIRYINEFQLLLVIIWYHFNYTKYDELQRRLYMGMQWRFAFEYANNL